MRILIVEDEVRLAEALSQIMAEQRYQTDVVYTGSDGLDYALTSQYDVIVPASTALRWCGGSAPPTTPPLS